MKIIKYPPKEEWVDLVKRPLQNHKDLHDTVSAILRNVKEDGDKALKEYNLRFDNVDISKLEVTAEEIEEAEQLVPNEVKQAIEMSRRNISKFHSQQLLDFDEIETSPGVFCWQKAVPIEKIGIYIPGGSAPLFSKVLMLGVPAQIAECNEVILCTPPGKDGKINPAILYTAKIAGIKRIFKVGGAQAIGAMAYGTESIPKVYKIFGQGNQYVTTAKHIVSTDEVAIDTPSGPSEVEVLADETSNPAFVAADLLSQAEYGSDSQTILVTNHEPLLQQVKEQIELQVEKLDRKNIIKEALEQCKLILLKDLEEAISMTNSYAPENLIIYTRSYMVVAERIINAGSVFLGDMSPESAGDYASGTNNTLPTNGFTRAYDGVNIDSFMKKMTFQRLTKEGLTNISNAIILMSESEGLTAHANAVKIRLNED